MDRRQFLSSVLPSAAGALLATPALAQDMGESGMAIPSFFFSRSERLAREACENDLPECRGDIRRQMSFEKEISLFIPWFGLGIGLIFILMYARKQEKLKEARRKMAQRQHVAGSFKNLDVDRDAQDSRPSKVDDRFS